MKSRTAWIWVVPVIFGWGSGFAQSIFGVEVGSRPVAVAVLETVDSEISDSVRTVVTSTLLSHGFRVFDLDLLRKLESSAVSSLLGEKPSPEDLARIQQKFEVDVLIQLGATAGCEPVLGRYWMGSSTVTCQAISTSSARLLGSTQSRAMGALSNPSVIAETRQAALVNALRVGTADILKAMGIADAFEPTPTNIAPTITGQALLGVDAREVTSIEFSKLGAELLVGTGKGEVLSVNLAEDALTLRRLFSDLGGEIKELAYQPGELRVGVLSQSGNLSLVDADGGSERWLTGLGTGEGLLGFSQDGYELFAFLRSGKYVHVSLDGSGDTRRISGQLKSQNIQFAVPTEGGESALIISESGIEKLQFSRTNADSTSILDLTSKKERWAESSLTAGTISEDRQLLAVAQKTVAVQFQGRGSLSRGRTDDLKVRLFQVKNGNEHVVLTPSTFVRRRDKTIAGLSFGSNWRFLAAGGRDGTIRVWDVLRGQEIATKEVDFAIERLELSGDSCWVAVIGKDHGLCLFRLE